MPVNLILTGLGLLATLGSGESFAGARCEQSDNAEAIVRLLESMPPWPILPLSDSARDFDSRRERARLAALQIEAIASKVSEHTLEDIRGAYELYAMRHASREAIDIMNRYLFEFPVTPEKGSADERMANIRYTVPLLKDGVTTPYSFPWYVDDGGKVRFSIEARGLTGFGTPYDPLKTFDYFRVHFGRRKQYSDRNKAP